MSWPQQIVRTIGEGGIVVAKAAFVKDWLGLAPATTTLMMKIPNWELIHLPTGHAVCIVIAYEKRALELAEDILRLGDWSFSSIEEAQRLQAKMQTFRNDHRSEIFPARAGASPEAVEKIRD